MEAQVPLLILVYNDQDGLERSPASLTDEVLLDIVVVPFSPRSPLARVAQILWFVLVPLLPNPWARRLVQLALAPARRPPCLSGLLGLDGGRAKRNES